MEQETKIGLSANEILAGMSANEWTVSNEVHNIYGNTPIWHVGSNDKYLFVFAHRRETDQPNAEAICNAVNGSYLKGYDPVYFEEVIEAVVKSRQMFIDISNGHHLSTVEIDKHIQMLGVTMLKVIIK